MMPNKKIDDVNDVPRNLDECLSQLETFQGVYEWSKMNERDALCDAHHGIGRWIRNCWNLWTGGELVNYFNDMGIAHPDDMSSIILMSLHRKMNGRDICLGDQVEHYIQFWKDAEKDDSIE